MQTTVDDTWDLCLAKVAQQQCKQSFAQLFEHFAPRLKAYAMAQPHGGGGNEQLAEELVQEVMIKVWKRSHQYDAAKAAASTWIFTIARNTRIDLLRRGAKHSNHLDADDVWLEAEDGEPEREFTTRRNQQLVRNAMSQLPVDQAQVLAKVYIEGKSHSEVAEELALPLGTVKSRVRLAMAKMKLVIDEQP